MTITDFVWIAIGETLLAGTFALGMLVGVSLKKRISHDNCNEGTGDDDHAEQSESERGTG
jgi:hypothetical protein